MIDKSSILVVLAILGILVLAVLSVVFIGWLAMLVVCYVTGVAFNWWIAIALGFVISAIGGGSYKSRD